MSGPTYPIRGTFTLEGEKFKYHLPRTHPGETVAQVKIPAPPKDVSTVLLYRRFKTSDPLTEIPMVRQSGQLVASLPHQPPAGKLEYFIQLRLGNETVSLPGAQRVVIRFRGDVAAWALIPHILAMFLGMLFSTRAGFAALRSEANLRSLSWWSLGLTVAGGLILGPIVQQQAFGAYWTGIPFGHDLTDNKTLIAAILWLAACLALGWREGPVSPLARRLTLTAAVLTFIIFVIPHSMLGSELDYSKTDPQVQSPPLPS
jgi:hypothetical protein